MIGGEEEEETRTRFEEEEEPDPTEADADEAEDEESGLAVGVDAEEEDAGSARRSRSLPLRTEVVVTTVRRSEKTVHEEYLYGVIIPGTPDGVKNSQGLKHSVVVFEPCLCCPDPRTL